MRIRSLSVEGFRGFNEHREIHFDDRLTVFYAPNSYGKTSITEALEWLLYGYTSKVKSAEYSKEEYKDSYRNVHFPDDSVPCVTAVFGNGTEEMTLRSELLADDRYKHYLDGKEVAVWPFESDDLSASKPFILQHALKNLLLVKPSDRYQAFALLLGLDDLGRVQDDFVSFATRYRQPAEVERLCAEVDGMFATAEGKVMLANVSKLYKSGKSVDDVYAAVLAACATHLKTDVEQGDVLPRLISLRNEKAEAVFAKPIKLDAYSDQQTKQHKVDIEYFTAFVTEELLGQYLELAALATVNHIHERARFFDLGVELLGKSAGSCPLCGRPVDDTLAEHIRTCHKEASEDRKESAQLDQRRTQVQQSLSSLKQRLDANHLVHVSLTRDFLALKPSLEQLRGILAEVHASEFQGVEDAVNHVDQAKGQLDKAYQTATEAVDAVMVSVEQSKEESSVLKQLGEDLVGYASQAKSFTVAVAASIPAATSAANALRQELDVRAGTEDVAVLIQLLENRKKVEKKKEIDRILAEVKDLRRTVDQLVSTRILEVIAGELTSGVLGWYDQIKTSCDPEVHFCGFDVPRTKTGELKARCISINAVSYGKSLPSAVSSLSESKLNALGLCLCIGSNMNADCPFGFLIIDDPIQSLDVEHEAQFVEILRELVEQGKQLVVLSHNKGWVERLVRHCSSLNGAYYEITGYDKTGPHVKWQPWEKTQARLDTIDAIVKDNDADSAQLARAEAELRFVVCEVTSDLFEQARGERKPPNNLGCREVTKMLNECSVDAKLVDRVKHIFTTADDAHHDPVDYAAQRERIARLRSYACELYTHVKAKGK